MKIAIIGGGVSGISAAYLLSKKHEVSLFESGDYLGGHTNTIETVSDNQPTYVDTGFIVFNTPNYPNFNTFIKRLGVESQDSNMSFSFWDPSQPFYYSSIGLKGLFSQKKNIVNPKFYRLIKDIHLFNKKSLEFLESQQSTTCSMKTFIEHYRFSDYFITSYLLPMGAAIWSCSYEEILRFPATSFINFWKNHNLLTLGKRPTWKCIKGGSFQYVKAFEKQFNGSIYKQTPIASVRRSDKDVVLVDNKKNERCFDCVVFAVHADQVLKILEKPSTKELMLFKQWEYSKNNVILHTDTSVMPPVKAAWASWNYQFDAKNVEKVSVTYYMNMLQSLSCKEDFFVTLNSSLDISPEKVIKRINYTHPIFSSDSIATQVGIRGLNGKHRSYFCGSYLGYGFHEDAISSSVDVAQHFGIYL